MGEHREDLEWIEAGRQFRFDDLVFWSGKSLGQRFEEVVGRIDTIVSGPHASAAFPEELRPFVSSALTRRKQHDYSDISTGPIGRAWAELDPHVVFVANAHSRVVLDPNRHRGPSPEPQLREFFARLRRLRAGGAAANFSGVDAVRPVTFALEDVLVEPGRGCLEGACWQGLIQALNVSAALGPSVYEESLEKVISAVLAARPMGPLSIISLHDTSNYTMRPDGAIVVERAASGRLPALVNFGNLGNALGDASSENVSTPGPKMRRIAAAWAKAFGVEQDLKRPAAEAYMEPISLNRPYPGNYEVRSFVRRLQAGGLPQGNVFQVEFERAKLLGPAVTAALRLPGTSWPAVDTAHVMSVAERLKLAGDLLRGEAA